MVTFSRRSTVVGKVSWLGVWTFRSRDRATVQSKYSWCFLGGGVGSGDEVDSRKFRVNDRSRRLSYLEVVELVGKCDGWVDL